MTGAARVTTRGLGRALLARQHLDARTPAGAVDEVAHLVALQSQNPSSAYLALHARVAGFDHADLATAMLGRRVGRLALLRDTVHLVTADDALTLWPLLAPVLRRHVRSGTSSAADLRDVDLDDLASAGREALAGEPLTAAALGARLGPRWPGVDPRSLATGVRGLLPLVQVTPRGVWGRSLVTTWTTAEQWFGRPVAVVGDPEAAAAALVRRYLAAYGPATVADVQAWSGLTRLAGVVEGMRDELVEVLHADGPRGERVLLDLPGAPLPGDVPVPVRLLPDFDDVLLGHADRTRIVTPEVRPALASRNGVPPGTVLLDGVVAGTWRLRRERRGGGSGTRRTPRAVVTLTPLRRWTRAERSAARAEARVLAAFAADDAVEHDAVVAGD
ncbi:winged helix DNA-binding domain-containing protein [Cellulomonas sp. C5510]|uniref:winged helix DNA-binding domain-containing protein n=1 Tax=Cellulomonas sp. C5510 TaxID=2871170 RepID=UPI001C96B484|nr:winged helix DNA-binding domain-containing protein [Cellulomonas sp. C5510]QZN84732.1 winged helix DNA-binding domain-containing protein [Cellulomonas sp. C5510]